MPPKFYFDEDCMSQRLIEELKSRGIDVISALDAHMIEKPEKEHLIYAASQGRVLYSFNVKDFHSIHFDFMKAVTEHAGILLSQQQKYSIGEQMRRLIRFSTLVTADEMKNRMEFLSIWG